MGFRTAATGESHASQRGRCPHQPDEIAAGEIVIVTIISTRGSGSELSGQALGEGGRILTLSLAPPESRFQITRGMLENLFHRWQPPQFTGGLTFHSSLNLVPNSRCSEGEAGCQFMLKISDGGRRKFSGAR